MEEDQRIPEAAERFFAQLPAEDAAELHAYALEPNPWLEYINRLYRRVDDGTATPEELAEYEEMMRPIREEREAYKGRKVYDDRA